MKHFQAATLVIALLLCACGGSNDPGATAPLPDSPAATLAQRLVAAEDLDTAVAITREVLARGGVATVDGDRVLVEPIGAAAAFRSPSLESLHLAMEARQRPHAGRLTADAANAALGLAPRPIRAPAPHPPAGVPSRAGQGPRGCPWSIMGPAPDPCSPVPLAAPPPTLHLGRDRIQRPGNAPLADCSPKCGCIKV